MPIEGWFYQSINWEDSADVLEKTLREKKPDGSIKFKGGVAQVSRISLENIGSDGILEKKIKFNRDPILPEKPFHGNVLLHEDFRTVDKHERARFYGKLATAIIKRIPNQIEED